MKDASKKRKRDPSNEDYPDVHEVLDAVLDEKFESLQTDVSKPKNRPNPQITTTIAKRSPQLISLKLSFQNSLLIKTDQLKAFVLGLGSLNQLRELTLSYVTGFEQSLRFLGQACPQLTSPR